MIRSTVVGLAVVLLVAKAVTNLNLVSSHWEERTQMIELRPQPTKGYEVATLNGTVEFIGQDDLAKAPELIALCKAGASTTERAQKALDAIEVTTDRKDADTSRIGWRWRNEKEPDWSAEVDFTIHAPKNVNLKIESHNGQIVVKNLVGNANVRTHNGQITAATVGESLNAETDNGRIAVKFAGQKVRVNSRNGRIVADLSDSRSIEGEIGTHNGMVEVTLGKQTACELITKTRHGWRNSHGGRFGSGGGKLVASSHNGAVLINAPSFDTP